MKMTTSIPPAITTPDAVETSLGTLKFFDGLPDQDTVQKVFENLDRMRGDVIEPGCPELTARRYEYASSPRSCEQDPVRPQPQRRFQQLLRPRARLPLPVLSSRSPVLPTRKSVRRRGGTALRS